MRLFELNLPEKGTYVAAKFSDATIEKITAFQSEHEIPNPVPPDDLHSTIVYSVDPIEWQAAEDIDAEAKPVSFDFFGKERNCLVLKIESEYLSKRFDEAIEAGASFDFPSYEPHITLSYDCAGLDISKLPVPTFDIDITHEFEEPIDRD